jgi:hypothetical protein
MHTQREGEEVPASVTIQCMECRSCDAMSRARYLSLYSKPYSQTGDIGRSQLRVLAISHIGHNVYVSFAGRTS